MAYEQYKIEMRIDRLTRVARNLLGQYTSLQGEALAINRRLAQDLAQLSAEELERGLVRRAVSTGRLKRAILDPENYEGTRDHILVGREDYLDNSPVNKYWRQIEGSRSKPVWTTLVDRGAIMVGYWTDAGGANPTPFRAVRRHGGLEQAFVSTTPPKRGAMQRAQKVLSKAGAGDTQAHGRGGRYRAGTRSPRVVGQVRRGIRAERYFGRAWKRFDDAETYQLAYAQAFARTQLPVRFRSRL